MWNFDVISSKPACVEEEKRKKFNSKPMLLNEGRQPIQGVW